MLAACGGAKNTSDTSEAGLLDPGVVADQLAVDGANIFPNTAPASAAPDTCLFNLAAQRYWRPTVTASFEDSDIGAITTAFEGHGDGNALFATFESRDANGHERGDVEYECNAEGIRLRRVESNAGVISFSPPVLVLPASGDSGSATGVAGVRAGDVDTVVNWTHRWSAEVVAAPLTFATMDATWLRVASGLSLESDALGRSWETYTTWAITERGEFFAARVEQTIREAGQTRTRVENAESLVTTSISPNW